MLERKCDSVASRLRTISTLEEVKRFMTISPEHTSKRRRSTGEISGKAGSTSKVDLDEELPPGRSSLDVSNCSAARLEEDSNSATVSENVVAASSAERTDMDEALLQAAYQLFATERDYNWKLTTLMEAGQILSSTKFKSFVDSQLAAFFEQTSLICACSIAVMSRLEKIIANWKRNGASGASGSQLGAIFDDAIWERYNAYHYAFRFIRPIIRLKRRHDRKISCLCTEFEQTRLKCRRLECLLLLPEERIVAYNEHLDALVRCTADDHPDCAALKRHKDHIEQWMLESRRAEIRRAQNERKLDEIEAQFPVDRLDLLQENWRSTAIRRALATHSGPTMNNVKHFVGRRKSIGGASVAAPTWFRNSADNGDNVATMSANAGHQKAINEGGQHQHSIQQYYSSRMHGVGTSSSSSTEHVYHRRNALQQDGQQREQGFAHALKQQQQPHSRKTETFVRVYMKEGRVVLTTGVQAQERYLFLFSDLLLVAKEKGINSYRLKEKIRLCELWISDKGLEDVAETVRNPQNSFIIGWPTKSYIAEFKTLEERNSWYEMLVSTITLVKQKERPNTTIVTVKYKDGKMIKTCDIPVSNFQTAKEMLSTALSKFNSSIGTTDEFQLWVQSGRETAAYPLHGHEYPFAILLSHIRDLLPDSDGDVDVSLLNDLTVSGQGIKCNFVVKRKRGSKKKPSKHGAGQFVSNLKRKMKKQDSSDSACPPSPTGKLFGIPLDSLTETQPVPKPIMALMEHLATEGALTEGIFRKPPKNSTLRELREKLDAGCDVQLDGVSPSVSASLLKEFLRQLPDALLGNDRIHAWASLCDETIAEEKLRKAKSLASQLPHSNSRLLRYFLCLLHIIASRSSYNQMNSFNLGVCVAPSLTGSSRCAHLSGMAAKRMSELAQYLIDNVVELFGEDTLTLLKGPVEEPDRQPHEMVTPASVLPCSNGDYFDLGHMKPETSSLDSLTATGSSPSCSRPHSSLHHQAVNVSRDSGLCEPQVHSEDIVSSAGTNSRLTTIQRCVSQSEDTEDDAPRGAVGSVGTQSIDDLTLMNAQKRKMRTVSDYEAHDACGDEIQPGRDRQTAPREENGLHRQQVNAVDSTDSIYESAESNTSMADYCQTIASTFRSSKRMPSASLIRSASGDHLYLTERVPGDDETSLTTTSFRTQDLGHCGRQRQPRNDAEHSPLTVSLTTGDSSYGSSPVSPESNECNLGTNGNGSSPSFGVSPPNAVPLMARNSAYRRPARYRKGALPQPSSPTNVCVDDAINEREGRNHSQSHFERAALSTDTSNDDEADSGVHVMEVHTARPIVISCNCESSSSISSDDEKVVQPTRKCSNVQAPVGAETSPPVSIHLQPASPPTTVISEIYPLKSPSLHTLPGGTARFIVDSAPIPAKVNSPVIRRHSARVQPISSKTGDNVVRHSFDEANSLTERVFRGLELMMEKVENAHISQEKLLRSRLSDSVNDSSTVTETSSEESTPQVSRESSSAQDYKKIACGMFDRSNFEHANASNNPRLPQPRSYQTLPFSRSGVNNSDASAHPTGSANRFAGGPASVSASAPNSTTTFDSRNDWKPFSHSINDRSNCGASSMASFPRYRAYLVNTNERPLSTHSVQLKHGDNISKIGSVTSADLKSGTKAPTLIDNSDDHVVPVRIVPVVPGQVHDRIQRYDRERLRRKTLGGAEYSALAQLALQQTSSTPPATSQAGAQSQVGNERRSRYEQQRSAAAVPASIRNHMMKTQNPQSPRSKSLDRKTAEVKEERRKDLLSNSEDDHRRRQDISWSVRRYVEMFDKAGNRTMARNPSNDARYIGGEEKYSSLQRQVKQPCRGNPPPYWHQPSSDVMSDTRRYTGGLGNFPMSSLVKNQNPPLKVYSNFVGTSQRQTGNCCQQVAMEKIEPLYRHRTRTSAEKVGNSESYV